MAWPARSKDAGGIRHQFHHVIDIVPTILEAAGIPQPVSVNGLTQRPIEGVSMAYTGDKANANAPGKHTLEFDWRYDGPGVGKGGTGTLKVDAKVIDSHRMERSLPFVLPWSETFDVGIDTGTPVDDKDYQVPFRFTGKLAKLTIKLGPGRPAPDAKKDRERD
jgi:hypothetical protein